MVGIKLDLMATVAEKRTMNKLLDIMDDVCHPLDIIVSNHDSSMKDWSILNWTKKGLIGLNTPLSLMPLDNSSGGVERVTGGQY